MAHESNEQKRPSSFVQLPVTEATFNRLLESLDRMVKSQVDLQEELNSERRRVSALQNENDTLALSLERERALRKESEARALKLANELEARPAHPQRPTSTVPQPPAFNKKDSRLEVETEFLKEAYRRRLLGNHD